MLSDSIDFSRIKRVLVIKLRHHGDVLLTSPLFSVLKGHAPHIEADALIYDDTLDMLSLNPHIEQIHCVGRAWRKQGLKAQWQQESALLKQLKDRRFDLIIHLTENYRGMWYTRLLKPRYAAAYRYSAHRRGRLWKNTFTHFAHLHDHRRHTVEKHLDVLRRVGIQPAKDERRLTLVSGDHAERAIDNLLSENNVPSMQFIHIHPTSRWLFKCWTPSKFAALIDSLHAQGETVVVTGAPSKEETQFVAEIVGLTHPAPVSLVGRLSLKELAALTSRAKCFIGVDSAPMHIAAAMQTPVVALFGPSGDIEWGPWQVPSRVVTSDVPCRPCGQDGCGGSKTSECLVDIDLEQVLNAYQAVARRSA